MSPEFWLGLLAVPVLTLAAAAAMAAWALASWTWDKLHRAMLRKVEPAETAEGRSWQAEQITAALRGRHTLRMVNGFGWVFLWARDTEAKPDKD